jgi:hypothetical protein
MAGGMDAAPCKKSFTGVQSPRHDKAFPDNELGKACFLRFPAKMARCYPGATGCKKRKTPASNSASRGGLEKASAGGNHSVVVQLPYSARGK